MIKTRDDSRIEIWDDRYINQISERNDFDKTAVVIQAEHAEGKNYIVEVIDTEGDD